MSSLRRLHEFQIQIIEAIFNCKSDWCVIQAEERMFSFAGKPGFNLLKWRWIKISDNFTFANPEQNQKNIK